MSMHCSVFFFNDTATTEIYTLSLHDALPICWKSPLSKSDPTRWWRQTEVCRTASISGCDIICPDRKSTRLNSSHLVISYAVFCLKKKIRSTRTWLLADLSAHKPANKLTGLQP